MVNIILPAGFQQIQQGDDIVAVIFQGHNHGFTNGLQRGKMNNCIYPVPAEKIKNKGKVAKIKIKKKRFYTGNFLYSFQCFNTRIGKIINYINFKTFVNKLNSGM